MVTWPGGANYLPATMHHAGPYDVVVGHVARCPIYADLRQLELFRERCMIIDLSDHARLRGRPLLKTAHHPHAGNQAGTATGPAAGAGGTGVGRRRRMRRGRPAGMQADPIDT
jgi:hypothetical protein